MKVRVLVNLRSGSKIIVPGVYDDTESNFPRELYDEIEYYKKTGRQTLEILEDDFPKSASSDVVDMLDRGEDSVNIQDKPRKKKRSRRT